MAKVILSVISVMLFSISSSHAAFTVNISYTGGGGGSLFLQDSPQINDQEATIGTIGRLPTGAGDIAIGSGVQLYRASYFSSSSTTGIYPNVLPNIETLLRIQQTAGTRTYTITITDNAFSSANFPLNQAGYAFTNISVPTAITGTGSLTLDSVQTIISGGGSTPSTTPAINMTPAGSSSAEPNGGVFFATSSPFTIQTVINFTFTSTSPTARVEFGATSSLYPAPAPSGLMLAGLGLPVFGLLRRGFRIRKAEPTVAA